MRTGRNEVQQSLAAEAANVVWQAVGLARRRGNVQVTPLHIASAMLSVAGLLRAACLQSHSNPLQFKALELGFSVALSRLPMAARPAVAMFHHGPALSNALVAALKRAQSRQRRCSEDGLRQPAAPAAKVELEQLVISILDDPNVVRVMHEAGFSSSLVRANVEKAISLEQSNRESSKSTSPNPIYTKCSRAEPCLEVAIKVPGGSLALSLGCSSELQASQARSGWPTTFVGAAAGDREMTSCGTSLQATCCRQKFTDLTAENLKILCKALELRVPRHKDIVPDIATTVLQCRSGMLTRVRRRERLTSSTWLLFQGRDSGGKKAIAQELAKLVFGSYTEFTSITMAEFTPVNSDSSSSGKLTLKRRRSRDNENGYVGKRLFETILENPHRVFLINGIDQLDHDSEISIQNAIANGRMRGFNGDVVSLDDAIIALSCEAIDSWSFASSPPVKQGISRKNGEEKEDGMEKEGKSRFSLDLNACVEDGEEEEENSIYDVGLLNDVDGVFLFR